MEVNERLDKIESTLESLKNNITSINESIERLRVVLPAWAKPLQRPQQKPILKSKPIEPPKPPIETPNPPMETPAEIPIETPKPVTETSVNSPPVELINLLNSKEWPPAVDPSLICDISSEQDKEDRAEGILDLIIDIHLENLKFLDFGCGEGYVINRSRTQKPRMAVGYDIKKFDKWDQWEKSPNTMLTTDWNDVKSIGPYNIVLMYDVIDHMLCAEQELIDQLKAIKTLLAPNAKVYVRTHPWCSRHGTHLYYQLNKAFVHLVFTNEELNLLGYEQDEVRRIKHPQQEYDRLFTSSGFKILSGPNAIKEKVEPFFINEKLLSERIKSHYSQESVVPSLENQFIDYVLQ